MESIREKTNIPAWFVPYAPIRADSYVMLASLLGQSPSPDLLHVVRNLAWEEGVPAELDASLQTLRRAGHDISLALPEEEAKLAAEFDRLFVGLGRGEVVPYASWYRERKIQSLPLVSLRTDLTRLGIVRRQESHEPEDHAGALCEIMALISREQTGVPCGTQAEFFQKHLAPWVGTFFQDLQSAASADFYRLVGRFGACFLKFEDEYLRAAGNQFPDGGWQNEKRTFP